MMERRCKQCQKPLTKSSQRTYCSHPCATAGQKTRPVRTIACPCGETFTTTDPVQRYCSDPCRKRFNGWKTSAFRFLPRNVDRVYRL